MSKEKKEKKILTQEQKDKNETLAWYIVGTVVLIVSIIYFTLYKIYDFKVSFSPIDCGFVTIFHVYCPGCGGTRAIREFLNFHFIKSIAYNPIVVYGAIVCGYYYIGQTLTYITKWKKTFVKFHDWTLWGALIIIGANWIIRNLLVIFAHYDYIGDVIKYWS